MTDYTNSGALWKNDRKTAESQPDFTGKIDIAGKEYQLSAWTKRNDDGSFKLLSVKIQDKERRGAQQRSQPAPARDGFEDEDIPW